MKQRIISFFALVLLVAGLSLLLYPTISNYLKNQQQRRAINVYISSVETISEEDYTELLEQAADFNNKLSKGGYMLTKLPAELKNEYYSILDVNKNGIIGYINLPEEDIMLPIYHGTSEAVLQEGAGHTEGSSFPIEGESVHAIVSGHSGLPSALLFTNLDKVKVGDTFMVYILSETYVYQVQSIETVLPAEVNDLRIENGKNYCTLVTCTPYGINTHRLLIHGELMDEAKTEEYLSLQSGAGYIPMYQILIVFEIPVLILAVIIASRHTRKKR